MSNSPPYISFLKQQLEHIHTIEFTATADGHSIYVQDQIVGTVYNNKLYIKDVKASAMLAHSCELLSAYPQATPSYYFTDDLIDEIDLENILIDIAEATKNNK